MADTESRLERLVERFDRRPNAEIYVRSRAERVLEDYANGDPLEDAVVSVARKNDIDVGRLAASVFRIGIRDGYLSA